MSLSIRKFSTTNFQLCCSVSYFRLTTVALFIVVILSAMGCTATSSRLSREDRRVASKQVEALSLLEVAKEEIQLTPLSFRVPRNEDAATRERATYFFQRYLPKTEQTPPYAVHFRGERELLISSTEVSPFQYAVLREPLKHGSVAYRVACKGPSTPEAQLNAQNLSRFLQTGVLELALVIH